MCSSISLRLMSGDVTGRPPPCKYHGEIRNDITFAAMAHQKLLLGSLNALREALQVRCRRLQSAICKSVIT